MGRQSLRVLPSLLSRRVFISISIQAPISIVYALYSKLYVYCVIDIFVWLCGMNYWRNPQYNSWRRMIDIGSIFLVGGYHLRDQLFIRNYLSLVYCHILLLVFASYWKARKSQLPDRCVFSTRRFPSYTSERLPVTRGGGKICWFDFILFTNTT